MQASTASVIIPLYDRQEEWKQRIRMVQEAQAFIYISTYFIQYDRYGRDYISALLAACRRGVSVTLLIDGFGQRLASALMTKEEKREIKKILPLLQENGAKVHFYRCRNPLMNVLGSGIHIKIQLSETGGALFTSGNISATSYEKWREFSVYVEGAIVTHLLEEFTAMGVTVDGGHIAQLPAAKPGEPLGYISYNPALDPHPLNPLYLRHPNSITDYLAGVFASAQHSISLTSFYFKPDKSLLKALIEAAKRGVTVEIFHSHRDALGPTIISWIPSYHLYKQMLDAGIHIYENRRGEHSKIILIDGVRVITGSYNLEYASHERVAEAMMETQNPQMLAHIEGIFAQLRASDENIRINRESLVLPKHIRRKVCWLKPIVRWI